MTASSLPAICVFGFATVGISFGEYCVRSSTPEWMFTHNALALFVYYAWFASEIILGVSMLLYILEAISARKYISLANAPPTIRSIGGLSLLLAGLGFPLLFIAFSIGFFIYLFLWISLCIYYIYIYIYIYI